MRKLIAILTLGGALAVLTAFSGTSPLNLLSEGVEGAAPVPSGTTTSNMALYANSATGNDGYPCSQARPCKTVTVALNKIPHRIAHQVTLNVAAGTYPECLFMDFEQTATGKLTVTGPAMVLASIAGPKHGTIQPPISDGGFMDWTVNSFYKTAPTCGANDGGPAVCDGGVGYPDAGAHNLWANDELKGAFLSTEQYGILPIARNGANWLKAPGGVVDGDPDEFSILVPAARITGDGAGNPLLTFLGAGSLSYPYVNINYLTFDNGTNAAWTPLEFGGGGGVELRYDSIINIGEWNEPFYSDSNIFVRLRQSILRSTDTGVTLVWGKMTSYQSVLDCGSASYSYGWVGSYGQVFYLSDSAMLGCSTGISASSSAQSVQVNHSYAAGNGAAIDMSGGFNGILYFYLYPSFFETNTSDIHYGSANGADGGYITHKGSMAAPGVTVYDAPTGNRVVNATGGVL